MSFAREHLMRSVSEEYNAADNLKDMERWESALYDGEMDEDSLGLAIRSTVGRRGRDVEVMTVMERMVIDEVADTKFHISRFGGRRDPIGRGGFDVNRMGTYAEYIGYLLYGFVQPKWSKTLRRMLDTLPKRVETDHDQDLRLPASNKTIDFKSTWSHRARHLRVPSKKAKNPPDFYVLICIQDVTHSLDPHATSITGFSLGFIEGHKVFEYPTTGHKGFHYVPISDLTPGIPADTL